MPTNAACAPPGQGQGCRIRKTESVLGLSNRGDLYKQLIAQMSQQLRSQIGMTKPPGLSHSGSCCHCWEPGRRGASLGHQEGARITAGASQPGASTHPQNAWHQESTSQIGREGGREKGRQTPKPDSNPEGPTSVPAETRPCKVKAWHSPVI